MINVMPQIKLLGDIFSSKFSKDSMVHHENYSK